MYNNLWPGCAENNSMIRQQLLCVTGQERKRSLPKLLLCPRMIGGIQKTMFPKKQSKKANRGVSSNKAETALK